MENSGSLCKVTIYHEDFEFFHSGPNKSNWKVTLPSRCSGQKLTLFSANASLLIQRFPLLWLFEGLYLIPIQRVRLHHFGTGCPW
jgi:hypothetical protein